MKMVWPLVFFLCVVLAGLLLLGIVAKGRLLSVGMLSGAQTEAAAFFGTVDYVRDGDTIWVCNATICKEFRVCGIDAPEEGQPGYAASTEALQQLVAGKFVRCLEWATAHRAMGDRKKNQRPDGGPMFR